MRITRLQISLDASMFCHFNMRESNTFRSVIAALNGNEVCVYASHYIKVSLKMV